MQISKPFTNQGSSDSAVAAQALTHAAFTNFFSGRQSSSAVPAADAAGNPAVFAVGGGNPDSRLALGVNNQKRPFGFEFDYVFVGNGLGFDGINDNQIVVSQDQLWANPEQNCNQSEGNGKHYVANRYAIAGWVKNQLNNKNGIDKQRNSGPGKVASWSKGFDVFHASIIAGMSAVNEGK